MVRAGAATELPLTACPTWVWPNAGALGYFRVALEPAGWAALRTKGWAQLSAAEQQAAGHDLAAGTATGEVAVDVALDMVPALVASGHRPLIGLAIDQTRRIADWVPVERRPAFAAWVRKHFGRVGRTLGVAPRKGDDLDTLRLRREVIGLLAELGNDPALRKQLVALARDWRALPEAGRDRILAAAVIAEPALHDGLLADWKVEPDRARKNDLTAALGAVPDPVRLEGALRLMLDPTFNLRDTVAILYAALGREATRSVAETFVVTNFDALLARLPEDFAAGTVGALTTGCTAEQIAPMRALAEQKLGKKRGAARRIDQAFERMSQCVAQRAAIEPTLRAWLANLPPR